ncbi:hypothetical protein SteCoe_20771 [Stentor coeruleus]|uniref:Uncharacterized protein n=1 Tax=Stentor coeruleus TaxID=5963 RepID=A0A1R2BRD7_9CILI|nr:hypothetical protein SteCoe_20771 [Stentor coeruleus]
MKKVDVLGLVIEGKHRIETIPDLPKTLVYDCKKLRYVRTTPAKIVVNEVLISDLEDVIHELIRNSNIFPSAILKTNCSTTTLMNYQETLSAVQENIVSKNSFELQEYIPPENEAVMVIRIGISGQTITARVLENTVTWDSAAPDERKFLLSNFKKSGNMVLSSTTAKLKNSAMAIFYMISASLDKKYVMSSTVLDFIRRKNKWFFITAHCQRLMHSLSEAPKSVFNVSQNLLTPTSKPKSQEMALSPKAVLKIPEPYLSERKLEQNINKLISKEKVPQIRFVSYKQWSASSQNDLVYRTYSKKIASNMESVKDNYSNGLGNLKNLVTNMGEYIKHFELKYNTSEYIKKETGRFLLEHLEAVKKKNVPITPSVKKYTANDMISESGKKILDLGSAQLDKMSRKLKARKMRTSE